MLSRKERYAVFKTQPERSLVIATNYDSSEEGILIAPLNLKGSEELLIWVDMPTAFKRFLRLVMDFGRPTLHLC